MKRWKNNNKIFNCENFEISIEKIIDWKNIKIK